MFSFGLILASVILVTCLYGEDISFSQSNCNVDMINTLVDIKCRLKQIENILDQFINVDLSLETESTVCALTTSMTRATTTTSPQTSGTTITTQLTSGTTTTSSLTSATTTTSPLTSGTTTTSSLTSATTTTSPLTSASTTSETITTSPLTNFTRTTSKCPENWKPFEQSCYLFKTTFVNFTSAVEQCKSMNSHLVYVESSEENKFIKDNIIINGQDTYWIGLGDEDKDGTWKWVGTDSTATFLEWSPGQPDNTNANVKCAIYLCLSASCGWYGASCTSDSNFICEGEV